jgi:hypothetical protein
MSFIFRIHNGHAFSIFNSFWFWFFYNRQRFMWRCDQFNIVAVHHTINNFFHDNKGDILIDRRKKYSLCFVFCMASITVYISRVQSSYITCFKFCMASITEYISRVQSSYITCFIYCMASITEYISRVQSLNITSVSYTTWHPLQYTFPRFKFF